MFWCGVKFTCVVYILGALSVNVEGASKPVRLPASSLVLIHNAENVTGPSRTYTIETRDLQNMTRNESILQLSLLNHHLLPGDKLTFYDGNFTSVLKEYRETTKPPALSFFTTYPDAKVVFTANTSDVNTTRSFDFLYRSVPRDTDKECNYLFYGHWGNIDSTERNRSSERCRFTVSLPAHKRLTISLTFDNLTIPVGERLLVWETSSTLQPQKGNPDTVLTHADNGKRYYIGPSHKEAVILEFHSTTYFQIRFQEYKVDERFDESGEISFPMKSQLKYLALAYRITVPRGHVKLTVHDLYLPGTDEITVLIDDKRPYVRLLDNSTTFDTTTNVVSDSNKLMVAYLPATPLLSDTTELKGRFRMTYSTLDTAPIACNNSFPNAKRSKHFSELYEGWQDQYSCKTGYGTRSGFDRFTVLCQGNGTWTYKEGDECKRICPAIGSLYSLTSHHLYPTDSVETRHLDGDNVTFSCWSTPRENLTGHEPVTCTSSGKYSASPPYCTDNAPQSSNPNLALILLFLLSAAFVFHDVSQ